MAATYSEADRMDEAVAEAVDLVAAGDTVAVAASYVAEQHDLTHRFEDIRERVHQEVEADE